MKYAAQYKFRLPLGCQCIMYMINIIVKITLDLYRLFSHSVSLSLSLSAVLVGSADCGDTSPVASSSSFGFFVLGPYGLLLGRLHVARKYLSMDDGMSGAPGFSHVVTVV